MTFGNPTKLELNDGQDAAILSLSTSLEVEAATFFISSLIVKKESKVDSRGSVSSFPEFIERNETVDGLRSAGYRSRAKVRRYRCALPPTGMAMTIMLRSAAWPRAEVY